MSEPLRRVLSELGSPDLVERLAALPKSDLTSLWLAVARAHAQNRTPQEVLRRFESDPFCRPAFARAAGLRQARSLVLDVLPPDFEQLALAPVVPAGTHLTLGGISPNNVLTTVRGTEVAADNAAALTLEAASRRRQARDKPVKLAASQRLTRAQPFSGPMTHAHFEVVALVTAGRDTGHLSFEKDAIREHLLVYTRCLADLADEVEVSLTDWDGKFDEILTGIENELPAGVLTNRWSDRTDGRAYYAGLRFAVIATKDGVEYNLVDGGLVDWTQRLLSDRKERILTSGIGLDRLAVLVDS